MPLATIPVSFPCKTTLPRVSRMRCSKEVNTLYTYIYICRYIHTSLQQNHCESCMWPPKHHPFTFNSYPQLPCMWTQYRLPAVTLTRRSPARNAERAFPALVTLTHTTQSNPRNNSRTQYPWKPKCPGLSFSETLVLCHFTTCN